MAIVDPKTGLPSLKFTIYWQNLLEAQEAVDAAQSALIDQILAVTRTDAVSASYTVPTAILGQTDNGTGVTVTMAAHTRYYGDGSFVAVDLDTLIVPYGPAERVFYYDDPDREGGAQELASTLDAKEGQHNYVAGRHSLGSLTIISVGDPDPPPGGGSLPPGNPTPIEP